MSRKSKIDSAEKVKIVERLLADEISVSEAARLTGVDKASIRRWRNLYLPVAAASTVSLSISAGSSFTFNASARSSAYFFFVIPTIGTAPLAITHSTRHITTFNL